ncbi:MAG: membrane protein insertase YidC [Candidatus Zixiibacteriota bacterium]
MDKKTIIGIILIAAILFLMPVYNKLVNPPSEESALKQTATNDSNTDDESSLSYQDSHIDTLSNSKTSDLSSAKLQKPDAFSRDSSPLAIDTLSDSLDAKEIFIETNDMRIIMSTRGADIISLKLLDHTYGNGELIQMVPQDLDMPNLDIELSSGSKTYTIANTIFRSDKDTLLLDNADSVGAITFTGQLPDSSLIRRRLEFYANGYMIRHKLLVECNREPFDQYKLWWRRGLLPTEEKVAAELNMFKLTYKIADDVEKEKFKKGNPVEFSNTGSIDFASTQSKYFTLILAPSNGKADGVYCDGKFRDYLYNDNINQVPAIGIALLFRNTEEIISREHLLIASPADYKLLESCKQGLEDAIDLGWRWLLPITKLILWLFDKIYQFLPNYGFVILIFTLLMKLLLLPLASKQIKSMKEMQKIQPKLKELQEQYRDNPEKLNKATMALYKKHNVNPLGGCLPMIVQMPIFFALYRALSLGFQFRQATFGLWLQDLSSPDPYYVLPIIMAVTMFVQQKMTVKDPKQKMMVYIFPIFFLFIFRNMPAGLVLYWTFFNILTVIHNFITKDPEPIGADDES